MYLGDIPSQQTIDFFFTTVNSSGVPTTLGGTPAISVYKTNDVAQTTTGVTLTVDFDGVTGLNHVRIVTTNAFYATGADYHVVITTGTVGGNSVVGYRVAEFSIENRITKVDVAKISGDSTAADNLESAYDGTGYTDGTLAAYTSATSVTFPNTAAFPATADYFTGMMFVPVGGTGGGQTPQLITGYTTGRVATLWPGLTAACDTTTTFVLDRPSIPMRLWTAAVDDILKRDMSAVSGEAARSPLNALRFLRNKWTRTASAFTVYKEDDSTTAWSGTITENSSLNSVTTFDPS